MMKTDCTMGLWKTNGIPKDGSNILIEHEPFFGCNDDEELSIDTAYYSDGRFNVCGFVGLEFGRYYWRITRWCYTDDIANME